MQINYHQDMNQAVNDTIMALNYNYAPIYIQWNFKSPKKKYSKVIVLLLGKSETVTSISTLEQSQT